MIKVEISHSAGIDGRSESAVGVGPTIEQAAATAYSAIHPNRDRLKCRVLASVSSEGRYAVRFSFTRFGTQPGARRIQGVTRTPIWNAQVLEV
jgi:hypothetical protein